MGDGSEVPQRSALLRNSLFWFSVGGLVVLLAATIIASWAVAEQFSSVRRSHDFAQRTQRILVSLQAILSTLQDAETGERGFVITGDPTFRQPYERAAHDLETRLSQLNALYGTAGSPAAVAELSALSRRQLQYLDRLIELREQEGARARATGDPL
jgi:CHASE3 domain sensor protein